MSNITYTDKVSGGTFTHTDANEIKTAVNSKQDELVSNTHIKTVNSTTLVGAGDVAVQAVLTEGAFANGDKTLLDSIPAKLDGKENYHGVEAIGAVTFDDANHILSVNSVTFWYQGVSFEYTGVAACDIDDTLTLTTNTLYYFSFDEAAGDLEVATGMWNLHTKVPVALVFWNGTTGAIMKEWHSHTRDIDWHINAHLTIGARYYSGLALTTPTVGTPGALSIAGGTLYDEDLVITISNPQTTMRGWYLASSGVYTFADYSLPYVGTTGQPQFLNTSDYSLDNVGANDFVSMWVYGGNDTARPIYIIPTHAGTAHNTAAQARAETPPSLAGLNISPELKLLYKFIYRGNGAFIESVDYRQASSLPAGGTAAVSASSVSFVPTGMISALDVQGAIAEVEGIASGAQPDLGTVETAGNYLVAENELGVQGLYAPGTWKIFYTDGDEDGIQELSIGTGDHVLVSAGTGGPPVWEARGKVIASGTQALGTTEIANNACATVIEVTATGVATTDVIDIGYNSTPVGKTGYDPTAAALTLHAFPGTNEVNILVCNTTGAAVTPAAMTVNWRVAR